MQTIGKGATRSWQRNSDETFDMQRSARSWGEQRARQFHQSSFNMNRSFSGGHMGGFRRR
jgi:hypothetical protein